VAPETAAPLGASTRDQSIPPPSPVSTAATPWRNWCRWLPRESVTAGASWRGATRNWSFLPNTRLCCALHRPTVCLDVTSLAAGIYGHDDGKNGPTRCAVIGAARGGRWRTHRASRRPPAGACSTHSALAVGSRRAFTVGLDAFRRLRTTPQSRIMPCGDASPATCASGIRPSPPLLFLFESWLQCRLAL
jgi:hypothetical protein